MRDEMAQYQAARVQPFGINPAPVERHRAYADKLGLPFPLLSDPDREVSRAYGAVKLGGVLIARSVYLIGKNRTILFAARGMPGADVSLEALAGSG